MKMDRNKIIFASVIGLITAFIIAYSVLVLGERDREDTPLQQVTVPELEGKTETYISKKRAVDALEEKRERTAPSVYDERFLDSLGTYDPDLMDKRKERMVDSIYRLGRIDYTKDAYRTERSRDTVPIATTKVDPPSKERTDPKMRMRDMGLQQQLFFASDPRPEPRGTIGIDGGIEVMVDGEQVVKANDRLRLRTVKDMVMAGLAVPRNTLLYGIVRFRPNRAVFEVEHIGDINVKLKAYDLADGMEGIYIRNSFREEARNEVVGDIIEDINVPGIPQLGGIKKIFRRNDRKVKVTVNGNYRLVLKRTND